MIHRPRHLTAVHSMTSVAVGRLLDGEIGRLRTFRDAIREVRRSME
jgi:hypothetical protein